VQKEFNGEGKIFSTNDPGTSAYAKKKKKLAKLHFIPCMIDKN